ncbi:AAA family ATPase [uncultured Sphaerochaeta sp.]|uniref:AAA family ATPase n=1 Tax=uncultured Sphaerochaeta sp. TaxID=886478 RepID=UPI002A0A47E7|nr:AAA family ATPase [uncultured Sphaerochaeta sp.]
MTDKLETLENDIKEFVSELPYWAKYLSEIILAGRRIEKDDIDKTYEYLKESLGLCDFVEKKELRIEYKLSQERKYNSDLYLAKLENIEGVNALRNNQILEFNPKLTIIYGRNGSGKSGYTRLLKQAFHSKYQEDILPNIKNNNITCATNAKFTFQIDKEEKSLMFTENSQPEFDQFVVFDDKGIDQQLSNKNEFGFHPAGLHYFAELTKAVSEIEEYKNQEVNSKRRENSFPVLFEGESEIKTFVEKLSEKTKDEDVQKYALYTGEDKQRKENLQNEYDRKKLENQGKENEIIKIKKIIDYIKTARMKIGLLNDYFNSDKQKTISKSIEDCVKKEEEAKAEGLEKLEAYGIKELGTKEWKAFILSAEEFAKKENSSGQKFPENGDICPYCRQPLSGVAIKLIESYKLFIQSHKEENAKQARQNLEHLKQNTIDQNFNIFPKQDVLTEWMLENRKEGFESLQRHIDNLKEFSNRIIDNINNKLIFSSINIVIDDIELVNVVKELDAKIVNLSSDKLNSEMKDLKSGLTYLIHKEKFNSLYELLKNYVEDLKWINRIESTNFLKTKTKITKTERNLSEKYYGQKYIKQFNEECEILNGNFGIDINQTGNKGKTLRQLRMKDHDPKAILSEGEKKIIALADFFSEIYLSEINKGIIFDDPVTSLDAYRKEEIANRIVKEVDTKQVIIFTHDLSFMYLLIKNIANQELVTCHWIEEIDGVPGYVHLNNTPSYEAGFQKLTKVQQYYELAIKCESPEMREAFIENGFAALRTCYEVLVSHDLLNGVVLRFDEQIRIGNLSKVYIDYEIVQQIQSAHDTCCRFMIGHSHSDLYQCKKPETKDLLNSMEQYKLIKRKIHENRR